jgi:hypothetical protein
MRRTHYIAVLVPLILALCACSGIETHPAPTDTFAQGNYHYYKWRSQPLQNTTGSADSAYVLDPVLREQLDAALQDKGYVQDEKRAQFSVDYIFASLVRDGVVASEASNLSTYPGVIPSRNVDQASIDNAYALGGVQETRNIGIQFNDVKRNEEVWRVIITKIVEDANTVNTVNLDKSITKAVRQALRTLPDAR